MRAKLLERIDNPVFISRPVLEPFDAVNPARDFGGGEAEYALLQAAPKGPPQTMLYCIWQDPWMSVSQDTYIARMLAEIGWRVPDLGASRYPEFRWSRELIDSVDGVLLSSEPYRFTEAHVDVLERQIGKPVLLVDGEMMSWYGTRALAGLKYLRELAQR